MIPGLDGLRAIAFLLVFLVHTDYLEFGWVGVQLFFVLSGFLITGILLDLKQRFSSRDYFTKFYGRRFLRIFPLYYLYLFLMLGLSYWLGAINFAAPRMAVYRHEFPYAFAFIYDFFSAGAGYRSVFLGHFWSLSVEEQFYIVWPLLIFLVPEKHLKKLFIAFVVVAFLFRLGFLLLPQLALIGWSYSYALPFTHLDAFALGAYLSRFKLPQAKKQFALLIILVPVAGFAAQFMSTGNIGRLDVMGYPFPMENGYQAVWGYSLLNYLFAVTISAVVYEGVFLKILEWKPLAFLGRISYGLYVYHLGVIWFTRRLLVDFLAASQPLIQFVLSLIAFLVTLGIAVLSYYLIERPVLSLKDKYFAVPEQPKASV